MIQSSTSTGTYSSISGIAYLSGAGSYSVLSVLWAYRRILEVLEYSGLLLVLAINTGTIDSSMFTHILP